MTANPPSDWPPPGQCYFCPSPPGPSLWTCSFHRTLEAYALTLVAGFLSSRTGRPSPNGDDWTGAVVDWLASDDSTAVEEAAQRYWPPDLDQQEQVALGLMRIGLLTSLVEQGSTTGSLPDLAALALTVTEREQLLREELDRIGASSMKQGVRFSVEATEPGSAIYRLSRGLVRKKTQRFRMTVSELGLIEQELAPT